MVRNKTEDIALRERVKELSCLYDLAQIAHRPGATVDEILQGVVELLPAAWQYPTIAVGRIEVDGRSYVTPHFKKGIDRQYAHIVLGGKIRGRVEVAYARKKPTLDEGPFLKEEQNLLEAIAGQVALIIERRQADNDRARLQEQLRHADRLATIGQLAAGVAHELNEPLANILGFAQLAQKHTGLSSQAARDLGKIVATSLHARQIISNLMLFSRQMPPQKTLVDLNTVIEEALCFIESRCANSGITLVRRLGPQLPEITADASQLRQVIVNLAVNAIQAMPGGGTLAIATRSSGGCVVLIVEDNGIGMSKQVLNEIFIPFFTTKDVNEGTGLGLPVVHGIVTSHGGAIRVESAPGQGARFEIELPAPGEKRRKESRTNDTAR
ncbi:MAG TPA: ATP-binding protein [Phycisphaerae bacterium]|nr:ATP-binding protein [Phycisphaerae bacterium]